MPKYGALVYAAGTIGADVAHGLEDAAIVARVDSGELPQPTVARREGAGRVIVESSRWFYTMDYDGEFDTEEEFRACLENSIDTGDLSEPKVRQVTPIDRQEAEA